jgi:toxin FitB
LKQRYLLDTNVVSESSRKNPNRRVLETVDSLERNDVFLCDVVLAEIRHGIALMNDRVRQAQLEIWMEMTVIRPFADRTLQADQLSWVHWLQLKDALDLRRVSLPAPDMMIAAIAIQHSMHVVTRDVKPFATAGVPILNPFA